MAGKTIWLGGSFRNWMIRSPRSVSTTSIPSASRITSYNVCYTKLLRVKNTCFCNYTLNGQRMNDKHFQKHYLNCIDSSRYLNSGKGKKLNYNYRGKHLMLHICNNNFQNLPLRLTNVHPMTYYNWLKTVLLYYMNHHGIYLTKFLSTLQYILQ